MSCQIVFVLPRSERYEFVVPDAERAGMDRRAADEWLGREFEAAGCVPANPMGKLILADKVIQLARTIPGSALAEPTPWLRDYLRCVAALLERPVISIDLVEGKLGY